MSANLCHSIYDFTTDLPNLDRADPFCKLAAAGSWSRYDSDQHNFLESSTDENILTRVDGLPSDAHGYHRKVYNERNDDDGAMKSATMTATAIRELASLNVALYEHAANLPSLPNASTSSADTASGDRRDSQKAALFTIDEAFHLTKKFIDTIKSLSRAGYNPTTTTTRRPSSKIYALNAHHSMLTPSSTACGLLDHVGPSLAVTSSKTSCTFLSHADEATNLMVLSCYCRLTDIYVSIFQKM